MSSSKVNNVAIEAAVPAERSRLIRLCARFTGDNDAAEDLVQETLMEAWRSLGRLRAEEELRPWLTGIARNVCHRWARSRGHDLSHCASIADSGDDRTLDDLPAGSEDILIALERDQVTKLLNRALGILPSETRQILIENYVHERPQAELAARLGISEGGLRARLHRGKLALRRVLSTDLRTDAEAAGIGIPDAPEWQDTRIWCPFCGRYRIRVRIDRSIGECSYRCAGQCFPDGTIVGLMRSPALLSELTSVKSILTRQLLALNARYRRGLVEGMATCDRCGRRTPVRLGLPSGAPPILPFVHSIEIACDACRFVDSATLWHLLLDMPTAQRFWRRHPRMRALPIREIDVEGHASFISGFESVDSAERLEVVSARESYEILRIHGAASLSR